MGRFVNGLMTTFRVIQLILSLATLGCSAYIVYAMLSMSTEAHQIEWGVGNLTTIFPKLTEDEKQAQITLEDVLDPILHVLEGTPVRAYILSAVSLWSICVVIYLLVAQSATKSPRLNKRTVRITVEIFTIIFWIAGIVCAALLAMEYGSIVISGGPELKLFWTAVKPLVEEAIKSLFRDKAIEELSLIDDIFTIGALAILALAAACVCGAVSCISALAACCINSDGNCCGRRPKAKYIHPESGAEEYLMPMSTAGSDSKPMFLVSESSPPARWSIPGPR